MLGALSATTPSATCAAAVAPGRPVYRRRLHRRTADSLKDGIVLRFGDGGWIDSCLYRFYVERWIKPSPPSAEDVTASCGMGACAFACIADGCSASREGEPTRRPPHSAAGSRSRNGMPVVATSCKTWGPIARNAACSSPIGLSAKAIAPTTAERLS
ncbi:hypothetical protein [Lysobacter firmicutimachus]|uniref:Uncharacterized protein n=1 Tax=Lysobacter firmicutimachus TaxID=1792846 RepID=A0ABU8D2B8_9GAMM